jgi:ribose transport system ATP-binding protein
MGLNESGPPSGATPGTVARRLEMKGISKTFAGVRALIDAMLTVEAGEVHAVMGENGAGKSTLIKILAGAYAADPGGEIRIDGVSVAIAGPASALELGIAVIYQELTVSPNLTVAENIYLGREIRRGLLTHRKAMQAGCEEVLRSLGAEFSPGTVVGSLSLAERQLVEIARAVHANVRILVMDEPTAALSVRESERLFDLIDTLRRRGLAIIYVSHRMAEIARLADRVTVLRDGSYVGTLSREEIATDRIVRMMVGRDLASFYKREVRREPTGATPPLLEVREMSDGRRVRGCSFTVQAGEILGIAGLVGSGRTELARLIFGADGTATGTVMLEGRTITIRSPSDAIANGIVYLTEDRKGLGLFLEMSVSENINTMVLARDAGRGGVLNRGRAGERAKAAIDRLRIRVRSPRSNVGVLSGGNQQKVLLSRLLQPAPRVLILDEPTRGVDVGAKSEIYRIVDELAASGVGIVFISSELPEVIGIADRVVVMRDGRIVGELKPSDDASMTQESIMALATAAEHLTEAEA